LESLHPSWISLGGWRKLLKLRAKARCLLFHEVGDGSNIFFDMIDGILMGTCIIYMDIALYMMQPALSFNAKVSCVLHNGEWLWRPTRSEDLVDIQTKLSQVQIKDCDKAIWNFKIVLENSHVQIIGCILELSKREVQWWKLLWFPNTILKHGFIGWLAIQNRLATKGRLLQWGLGVASYSD
jgi:hypothetical protein